MENQLENPVTAPVDPPKASHSLVEDLWPYVAELQELVDEQNEKIDDLETACREIVKAVKKIQETLGGKFLARGEYFGIKV